MVTICTHLCLIYDDVCCCASTWECSPLANCERCAPPTRIIDNIINLIFSSSHCLSSPHSHLPPLCWGANSKTQDLTLFRMAPGRLSHESHAQQPSLLPWLQHQQRPGSSPTWETESGPTTGNYSSKGCFFVEICYVFVGTVFVPYVFFDRQRCQVFTWKPNCNSFFQ